MVQTTRLLSLSEATDFAALDSNTYKAYLHHCYSIYTIPNGGYVASIFMKIAKSHLSSKHQPDTVTSHWQFLQPSQIGPAIFLVDEVQVGKRLSVLQITLYQKALTLNRPWKSSNSKKITICYLTTGNIRADIGPTIQTNWAIPTPTPIANLGTVNNHDNQDWNLMYCPADATIPLLRNVECYTPRGGPPSSSTNIFWIRLVDNQRFDNSAIGLVSDIGQHLLLESMQIWDEKDLSKNPLRTISLYDGSRFPTVAMSLEIKKSLPSEGEEWLLLRVTFKQIKNGRFDIELIIFDAGKDLVALSNHVALVFSVKQGKQLNIRQKI